MWNRSNPTLSRCDSFSSATSGHSGSLSVMDILSLWNDDPEEVLLDLGFGSDEPDLSGRIPARFINHQSQARGINLQVFLEAQKNRLDLENPEVNSRFRELEVFQQVTTAFSSLVGSSNSPVRASQGTDLPPEAVERRRRVGMLFKRASKKSLNQIHNNETHNLTKPAATSPPCAAPDTLQPLSSVLFKGVRSGQEIICLNPLAKEQGAGPNPHAQPHMHASLTAQKGVLRPWPLGNGGIITANTVLQRKKSPGKIHSLVESSATGSYTRGAVQDVIRTNSCQSDNSRFLEELFIPSLSHQASPGSELIKALSGGSDDSQSSERPGSPFCHTSPSLLLSSSLTSPGDKSLLSSPCPSPGHSLVFDPSPSPVSLYLPIFDLQISKMEIPPHHDQSSPASLPTFACECPPVCSSSPDLQNVTHFQSPTRPSPASFTSLSHISTPMQPSSLSNGSEKIKTENMDAPSPHLSTLSHDSEGTVWSAFSTDPPSASSPSPILDYPLSALIGMSSTQYSSGCPESTQAEWTEVTSYANSLFTYDGLSILLPCPPYLPPYTAPNFHCPSSLASSQRIETFSQSPESTQNDSLFSGSGTVNLFDPPTKTHNEEEETPWSLSFQLYTDDPVAPPSLVLGSSKFKKGCRLSPNSSISVCQISFSLQSQDPDGVIVPDVGKNLTEQSISQQDRSYSHDDNTDPVSASSVQDIIHVKMDNLSLNSEDTLQMNGKAEVEVEEHSDTVQITETVVYNSETAESCAAVSERSRLVSREVWNQTEIKPQIPLCSLHELPTETKSEELRKVCQMELNVTESESSRSSLVLHDAVAVAQSRTKAELKDLTEIESLDQVFQSSVDGSEGENGDVDAFFQQVDTEWLVYWAEPIQVSNQTSGESSSFESSVGSPSNSLSPRGPAVLDSFSSSYEQSIQHATASSDAPLFLTLASFPSLSAIPDLKPSSLSVSVRESSSLSSHIVHRKDIPYMIDSKRTLLPSSLPLDTSTPFRAVQSWADLQIQRNTLTKKLSHGVLHSVPNKVTVFTSTTEMTQRATLILSSSPSSPLPSNDGQSHNCFPGIARNYRTVSLENRLWPEEDMGRNGSEDEEKLWEGNQTATMVCYRACDHRCTCCTQKSYNKQHTTGNVLCSMDELQEMILCLQQFCSVLSNMEEQLAEDQSAVYSVLSDLDRKKIWDIEELRRAVKQEAEKLEMHLKELAHHYDNSLKRKMHRLLDEQSLLYSQLRVFQPGMVPTSVSPAPNRTVATQCCLLPWIPPADRQSDRLLL